MSKLVITVKGKTLSQRRTLLPFWQPPLCQSWHRNWYTRSPDELMQLIGVYGQIKKTERSVSKWNLVKRESVLGLRTLLYRSETWPTTHGRHTNDVTGHMSPTLPIQESDVGLLCIKWKDIRRNVSVIAVPTPPVSKQWWFVTNSMGWPVFL